MVCMSYEIDLGNIYFFFSCLVRLLPVTTCDCCILFSGSASCEKSLSLSEQLHHEESLALDHVPGEVVACHSLEIFSTKRGKVLEILSQTLQADLGQQVVRPDNVQKFLLTYFIVCFEFLKIFKKSLFLSLPFCLTFFLYVSEI